jgi:Asp/Glu/hydantoin racemase
MRLLLLNPNTNVATTALMVARARSCAPPDVEVVGATVDEGAPLLVDPVLLAAGARAVVRFVDRLDASGLAGLIVAAFGDPGLDQVRARLAVPVTGIAEAAIGEASAVGRFAIVTTTPLLEDAIAVRVAACGATARYAGCVFARGDAAALGRDPAALEAALEAACREALASLRPSAIVIGGGPLAAAAEALAPRLPVPVIEPVPAAVRAAVRRAREAAR